MHVLYARVSHAIHPSVQRTMHKVLWEILPTNVDRTHTYGCTSIARSTRMHQLHPNILLHFLFKPNGHWSNIICYIFMFFEIHCLGLLCVPRSKTFIVKILCFSNFDICHAFVLYVKAQIMGWSVTRSQWLHHGSLFILMCLIDLEHANPCWKWKKKQNMDHVERLLLMWLPLETTLLYLVKTQMENNFGYCFVTNQSILWWKPSPMPIKIHIMIRGRYYELIQPRSRTYYFNNSR